MDMQSWWAPLLVFAFIFSFLLFLGLVVKEEKKIVEGFCMCFMNFTKKTRQRICVQRKNSWEPR